MNIVGACGHPNEADLRFCTECGASLAICPSCGLPTKPEQRFCGHCGTGLAATPAPAAREAERKQVTVLFADVVGSMAMAERLDADELSEVMQGLFAVCREAVEAFGGTVDKFTGDGIMALFGAPIAQEDHARRACHAALRLVEGARAYSLTLRQDVDVAVRVGLNSGEVVAGSVGEAFTAVGHTVGLAQRMEALAEPGTVRLTEHTADLVRARFQVRDLGPAQVKGSSVAVRVHALDAPLAERRAGTRASGTAPLVGREAEVATLRAALHAAVEGDGQIVGLVGEAGAGKSRLCAELADYAETVGVTVRRTAGVSHAQTVPLLPILGFLRDYFEVGERDGPEQSRDKIAHRMLALDPSLAGDLALMFDFLEVPDPQQPIGQLGPEARRRRVLEVIRRIAAARTEHHQAVLFVLEDLHWFDPQSAAFLEEWLPTYPGSRTLVVVNFRPEFRANWMQHTYYRHLPLAPLDDSAVRTMLSTLLGTGESLAELTEHLRARAGGNPFFAEELVRALAADGTLAGSPGEYRLVRPATEVRVPATVQAVLAGRIDRLPAREKSVLQAASVIGREFSQSLLAAVLDRPEPDFDASVRVLCDAELLVAEPDSAGDLRFWHPLTQEVAYRSLLGTARRRLHRSVRDALLAANPDRHDEMAALVAGHADAAGDDLVAAQWQLRAARWAIRSDVSESQRRWRAAMDHLADVPESPESLAVGTMVRIEMLRLGGRAGIEAAERESLFAAAWPAAEKLGDPAVSARLWVSDGVCRFWGGDAAGALRSWLEVHGHADRSGDLGMRAWCRAVICAAYAHTGPIAAGLASAAESIALCGGDPTVGTGSVGYSVHDLAHTLRVLLLTVHGSLEEAQRAAVATLAYYDRRPVAEWRSWTLSSFAHLADWTGETSAAAVACAAATEAMRLARDSGNTAAAVRAGCAAGTAALVSGEPDRALSEMAAALREARDRGTGLESESTLLANMARAHLLLGARADARRAAEEAVVIAARQGAPVTETAAHLIHARVLRTTACGEGDLAAARNALEVGAELAARTGARLYLPFLAEERARLDGDPLALKACADGYDAIGATGHARRLREETA